MSEWQLEGAAGVMKVVQGSGRWVPLVLDSPHSGCRYPEDFAAVAPMATIRSAEDMLVDALFDPADTGAVMLAAEFPRAYIDPNRPLDDIEAAMLAAPWPHEVNPGPKSALGKGLIWRLCLDGTPVYDRLLAVDEVVQRIDRCWRPYRGLLDAALDQAHRRAGVVWHINCHSMPSLWPRGVSGAGTPVDADFLLGDRDGTTCDGAFTARVREILEGDGYRVAVNDRFKGVDIVARAGDPTGNRHSLQIEVVRDRYMDEQRFEANAGFPRLRDALAKLIRTLHDDLS